MRYMSMTVKDNRDMTKRKRINLLSFSDIEKTKLVWKIRRQIQQKILEEKLMNTLSSSCTSMPYPEAMNPFVKDFTRKAENEIKRNEIYDLQHASLNKR